MVCRVDECPEGRRHGWQLKPIGQGLAIGDGRLCNRGGHLVHCLKEARQPDGTRLECWLKSAHWTFRSTTVIDPACSKWVPLPSAETRCRHHITGNRRQRMAPP